VKKESILPLENKDMTTNYSHSDLFLNWAEVFHWATKRHFVLAITGKEPKRDRRTEIVLRRLAQRKKLRTVRYGKKLIYALPRKTKNFDELTGMSKIYHGLACTECLVRLYRSGMDGEIIAERFFRGCGSVPEWGIRYPNNTMLLLEFSTKSNFLYSELMNGKINAYLRNLPMIEKKFRAKAVVLFVLDVPREAVKKYAESLKREDGSDAVGVATALAEGDRFPLNPFYFVPYEDFLKVPLGKQLTEPIYFWSYDEETHSLKQV
jgi:hypothetical protein